MGLTVLDIDKAPIPVAGGGLRMRIVKITFDSSYPTGGEALTAADCGLSSISAVVAHPALGYVFEYDYTNSKLLAYWADNDGLADSALIQVANTTSLATVITRALVIGVV